MPETLRKMEPAEAPDISDNHILLPPDLDPVEISHGGRLLSFSGEAFGTNYQVQITRIDSAAPERDNAWLARLKHMCCELLEIVDCQMSPWRTSSDLCRYNALEAGQSITLPEPMRTVVERGIELHAMTGGIFDIGIYAATSLWGFGAEHAPDGLPNITRKQALHKLRNSALTPILDGAVLNKQAGFSLDLCGIAKGYGVDLLLGALRKDPETSAALVEIGGEFRGFGTKPDGMPWWVELSSDDTSQGCGADGDFSVRTLVGLHEWACASSGGANRSFTHDGRQYSHAIDPETFEPVQTDIVSAHVFDRECWRADALATTLFAMGSKKALSFANQHSLPCLLLVMGENGVEAMGSRELSNWRDDD